MRPLAFHLIPFVPSGKDFRQAKNFFLELGFEIQWEQADLIGFKSFHALFILQNIENHEWQSNQMIVIEVDNLEEYWEALSELNLPDKYPGVKIKEPTDYPWGREIHLIDPAGVCWHVRELDN